MQDSLFSDLQQILPHLAALENKIDILRTISRSLDGSENTLAVQLTTGETVLLTQDLIPFNLEQETKKLVEDSIDEYQRQHANLKKLFDETNF